LDSQAYPLSIFKELYQLALASGEEQYKVFKSRIEIENFSGTSPWPSTRIFHAKVFTANFDRHPGSTCPRGRHPWQS